MSDADQLVKRGLAPRSMLFYPLPSIQVLTFDFDKLTGMGKLYPMKLEPLLDKKTPATQRSYYSGECHQEAKPMTTEDRRTLAERGVRVSMIARRFGNASNLATARVALRLAEVLIEEELGSAELTLQRPLELTEFGEYWQVNGRIIPVLPNKCQFKGDGRFKVLIAKIDCQVLDFLCDRARESPAS